MSSTAALRPGVSLGAYPEREDLRESWLDRTATGLAGFVRQRAAGRTPGHQTFLALVETAAQGLAELTDPQLKERLPELRRRLYSEGLQEELVARCFALVREVAQRRTGLRPFDVQLLGGRVMLEGKIAEMETGEGKTLTATLPACAAALAGIPVHIVTVNDFLVLRDAAWMSPIYKFLGITVGTISEGMSPDERRAAYACDICYGTNKQMVFDYLKDRLMLARDARGMRLQLEGLHEEHARSKRLLMRGLCFVIVDEADSVLVDEARTPLIISSAGDTSQEEQIYSEAVLLARQLESATDFLIRPREHDVELTEAGRRHLAELAQLLGNGGHAGIGLMQSRQRRLDDVGCLDLRIARRNHLESRALECGGHAIELFTCFVIGGLHLEKAGSTC